MKDYDAPRTFLPLEKESTREQIIEELRKSGAEVLRALGYDGTVMQHHINEGHAALLTLALCAPAGADSALRARGEPDDGGVSRPSRKQ